MRQKQHISFKPPVQHITGKIRTGLQSLRYRLLLLCVALILIPFLLSGTITYLKYTESVEQNARAHTLQVIDQITINLNRYIKDMDRITLVPFYDNSVLSILEKHSSVYRDNVYSTAGETQRMNLFLSSLSYDRLELHGIFAFANDGSLYANLDSTLNRHWDLASDALWMKQVRAADGELVLVSPHISSYYQEEKPVAVFSVARLIKQPETGKPLGIVKIDLTAYGLENILEDVKLSDNARLYITNQEGYQLYPTLSQKRLPISTTTGTETINGKTHVKMVQQSEYTGMHVIALLPTENLHKDAADLSRFTLVVSLLALLIACLLAVWFSQQLIKPLRVLQQKMVRVQQGAFDERVEVSRENEIGQLAHGFNTMVSEIDRLVKEVYETRLRERESELAALQSQMNPHFLYNTLESINMLAVQQQNYATSDAITSLGALLRYTIDNHQTCVHLREEIRFVEAYLHIQRLRGGENLHTEIHVDPSLDDCLIPKLILQPLIENAIEHGIGQNGGTVVLSARLQGEEELILSVRDNGKGLSPEEVLRLETHLHTRTRPLKIPQEKKKDVSGHNGVALRNVHQRLRLLYGEPYGLTVDTSVHTGSAFLLRVPFQIEEDEEA